MRLVEQELITVQILVSLCCTIFGYLCSILSLITCLFVLFFVAFVRLIFTVSRYPFGIFKPFLSPDLCFKRCSVRQLFVIWFVYEVKIISVFISVLKIPLYCLPFRSIWGPPVFSGVRVRSLVLCVMFYRLLLVHFPLTIVLSVLLRFTDSDNPFSIFKLFL